MAHSTMSTSRRRGDQGQAAGVQRPAPPDFDLRKLLLRLASLRWTVVLFAMAIFLVLVGTLAQVEKDIWQVVAEYFRTPWAWVELRTFFPPSFFPGLAVPTHLTLPGGFVLPLGIYFPGGWLIGALLMVNLLAAHLVRFPVQARGPRLRAGWAVTALGLALTLLMVVRGSAAAGELQESALSRQSAFRLFLTALGVLAVGLALTARRLSPGRPLARGSLFGIAALAAGLILWSVGGGPLPRLGNSSLRILGEMLAGQAATMVLLAGLVLLHSRRAGVVLLHGGIALLMFGEVVTGLTAVEGHMQMQEGETAGFVQDSRTVELAVVDRSHAAHDVVVAVPGARLATGGQITHGDLPFDIEVVRSMPNADLRQVGQDETTLANRGVGTSWVAEPIRPVSGTEGGRTNQPAAYLTLLRKGTSQSLGTYLVGLAFSNVGFADRVEVDGRPYDIALRYKRTYKPYTLRLLDVTKDDYPGTSIPRHYASLVHLVDSTRKVDRDVKIWMNNPLRFGGDTFYQSGYFKDPQSGQETSTLAVVTNSGRMIPYASCMIVATGLLTHFGIVLARFLGRRSDPRPGAGWAGSGAPDAVPAGHWAASPRFLIPAVLALSAVWLAVKARPPALPPDRFDFHAFGQLPVVDHGRYKPIDTLARTNLQILSGRPSFTDEKGVRQPALRWLLDLIARPESAARLRVFRIENPEVLETLGLTSREGLRYALDEFSGHLDEFDRQVRLAMSLEASELSTYQKKVLEVDRKLAAWNVLVTAFATPESLAGGRGLAVGAGLSSQPPSPLIVPGSDAGDQPMALPQALARHREPGPPAASVSQRAARAFAALLDSYARDDPATFNRRVGEFQTLVQNDPRAARELPKVRYEAFYNNFQPIYYAATLYVAAFVFAALAWLGRPCLLNRIAFALVLAAFGLHLFVLASRIYISGRPPVTNLYSSAVFIGWAAALLGIVFELVYRIGIGNVIASVIGFVTLLIAHFLGTDSDTFAVLQAVLDTQFWLATHVVCITLGYSATYVAGLLGLLFIVRGVLTLSLGEDARRDLARMIYGTICFAIFFSFVGTVLGGLWADDSWGRFWGWDPKENGALIIVLWNVMVLHALKGGMVKQRGLAVLAVAGNITVSWSWFGVNELGIGLHSYGFTEGVLKTLGLFVASQLLIVALGLLPEHLWRSQRLHRRPPAMRPLV